MFETEVEIEGKCDDTQSDSEDTGHKKNTEKETGQYCIISLSHFQAQVKGAKWKTLNPKLFPGASPYQPYSTWVESFNIWHCYG